ncbi:hypothetical protein ACQWF6_25430, partial [Salmonella enterica subsp. enterica serovar Infantis]
FRRQSATAAGSIAKLRYYTPIITNIYGEKSPTLSQYQPSTMLGWLVFVFLGGYFAVFLS